MYKAAMPTHHLYRFHWLDHTGSEGPGTDAADAFARLGYGAESFRALDYWENMRDGTVGEFEPKARWCYRCGVVYMPHDFREHCKELNRRVS